MAHPIEPGPIWVVSVNSPCCYWVNCRQCTTDDDMAKALKSLKLQPHPDAKIGDRVVINLFGRLRRGILQRPTVMEGLEPIRCWEAYCLDLVKLVAVPLYDIFKLDNESDILKLPEQLHLIALDDCYRFMEDQLPQSWHDDSFFIDQIERTKEVLRGNKLILEKSTIASPNNLTFGKITLYIGKKRVPLVKALAASPWLVVYSKNYMEALQEQGVLDEMKQLVEIVKMKINPPPKKCALQPMRRYNRATSKAVNPIDSRTAGNLQKMLRGDIDVDVSWLRGSAWTETLDEYNSRLKLIKDNEEETSASEPSMGEEEEFSQFEDAEESSEIEKAFNNGLSNRKYPPDIYDDTDDGSWDYVDDFASENSSTEWESGGLNDVLRVNKPHSTHSSSISLRESPPSEPDNLENQVLSPSCSASQLIDSKFSASAASENEQCTKDIVVNGLNYGRGKLFESINNRTASAGLMNVASPKPDRLNCETAELSRLLPTKFNDHPLQRSVKSENMLGRGYSMAMNRFQNDTASVINSSVSRGRGCLLQSSNSDHPGVALNLYTTSDTVSLQSNRPPSIHGKGRGNLLKDLQDRQRCASSFSGRLRASSTSSSCSASTKESSAVTTSIEDKSIRPSTDMKFSNNGGKIDVVQDCCSTKSDKELFLEHIEKRRKVIQDPKNSSIQSCQSSLNADCQPSSTVLSSESSSAKFPSPHSSEDKTDSDSSFRADAVLCGNPANLSKHTQFQNVDSTSIDEDTSTSATKSSNPLRNSPPREIVESLRNASCAGILHGNEAIRPVKYLAELHLHQNIYAGPKTSKVDLLTRPQQLAMPALLDRKNVAIIAPDHCKKTTGFIIPILNLLFDEECYSELRKGLGPRCVLVAPTSDRVKKLGKLCSFYSRSRLKTIITYGGGLEVEQKNQLAEGCDILVTTPRCWLRLLKYSIVTNLIRVCHVVLDGFDELSRLFMDELKEISAKLEFLRRERKQSGKSLPDVQTVVVGKQWSARIEGLIFKILNEPVLVITSFLEASLYARIKPTVSVIKIGGKLNKVEELIKKYAKIKTVVVCNDAEEVGKVLEASCSSRPIFTAHDEMSPTDLSDVYRLWSCATKPPLLICSDGVVNELNIMDAQVLINYSLPMNKTSFSERFQLVLDHIPDRILGPEASIPDVTVHILFDESNEQPFPTIVDFLQRIPVKLPEKVLSVAKDIERDKELTKVDAPFCNNILQMGYCPNSSGCKERHVVHKEIDMVKNDLNISQKFVKVLILRVHSAVKFSVRILSYTDDPSGAGSWEQCSSQWGIFPAKMASYFSTSMNLRLHSNVEVGGLVAYQSEPGEVVYRAQVRRILKKNDRGEPTSISIFLIDECDELKVHAHLIYELPDHLKNFPPQACYMYLANLKPVDLDTTWNYAACRAVERAVYEEIDRNYEAAEEIIGKVLFSIGQNVIVENLRWFRQLEFSRVVSCDLRKLILDSAFGLANPDYAKNLTLLCKEGGLLQDNNEDGKTQTIRTVNRLRLIPSQEKDVPPRWAHLALPDEFETDLQQIYQRVTVSNVGSPSLFFVKLTTHNKSLQELESTIAAEIEKTNKPLTNPCVGELSFAKLTNETSSNPSEGIYRRCKIQWLDMDKTTATVFFVDYGNEGVVPLKSLYKAPWSLMIRIPFQAIECSLAGLLTSSKTGWPTEAIEAFKAWTKSHSENEPEIFVKVATYDQHAEWTDGKRYHIMMVHVHDQRCDLINERLIDRFWAYWENEPLKLEPELNSEVLNPTKVSLEKETEEEPLENGVLTFDFDECDDSELEDFCSALIDKSLPKTLTGMSEIISGKKLETKAITGAEEENCLTHSIIDKSSCASEPNHEDDHCVPLAPADPEISLSVVAGFLTPFLRWRQDYRTVSLSFSIPATKNYFVYPTPTRLVFSAIVVSQNGEEKKYFSSVDLYGLVQTTHVKVDESHSSIRVTLQKMLCTRAILWPRLTRKVTKDSRFRGYDDEDSDEDQNYPAAPSTKGRYRPAGSDDDDSSDDETSDDDDSKNGWDDFDFC